MRAAGKTFITQRMRSPLKDKPLRNPGQSLDEQIRNLISDYTSGPLIVAGFLISITVIEWLKYYQSAPPMPVHYSLVTLPFAVYAIFRFFRVRRRVKVLRLGRDGEKAVGQFLEGLRERGYRVFHDMVGDGSMSTMYWSGRRVFLRSRPKHVVNRREMRV